MPGNQVSLMTMNTAISSVTTTSTTILAANADRKYLMIFNADQSGNSILHVRFDATASTTTNSFPIPNGKSYEFPEGFIYTGEIRARSASGTITCSVMEGS